MYDVNNSDLKDTGIAALIIRSESYSRKYAKLLTMATHACSNITEKTTSLKERGLQMWLCLIMF